MPPKQATLGRFFTLPAGTKPPVQQQTKLKATKKDAAKEEEEDETLIISAEGDKGLNAPVVRDEEGDSVMAGTTEAEEVVPEKKRRGTVPKEKGGTVSKKRGRKLEKPAEGEPESVSEKEDQEPVTKRGRRSSAPKSPEKGKKPPKKAEGPKEKEPEAKSGTEDEDGEPVTKRGKHSLTPKSPAKGKKPTKKVVGSKEKESEAKSGTEDEDDEPVTKRGKRSLTPKSPVKGKKLTKEPEESKEEESEARSGTEGEDEEPVTKRGRRSLTPKSPAKGKKLTKKPEESKEEESEAKSGTEGEDEEPVTKRGKRSLTPKSPAKEKKTAKKLEESKEELEVKSEVEDEDDEPVTKRGKRSTITKTPKKATSASKGLKKSVQKPRKPAKEVAEESEHTPEEDEEPVAKCGRKPATSKKPESPKKKKAESPKRKAKSIKVEELDEGSKSAVEEETEVGSDGDMKPALAEKARKVVAKQLSGKAPSHPFPDWKAGSPTPYGALVQTFALAEATSKRLEKLSHASLFLRQVLRLTPDDLLMVIHLMINKLAADYEGVELGIGESLLMKAIGESCGRSMDKIREDQNAVGDLGMVAMKSRNNQGTLFKPKPLTVKSVHQGLLEIATIKGEGGQGRKVAGIKKLLAAAKGDEAKYLVRGLEGKLRTGLADNTVIVALSQAGIVHEMEKKGEKTSVSMLTEAELKLRSVFSELPSYEVIIPAMMEHGILKLKDVCKLQPGVPLKPMLAKPTKAISEVLDRFENKRFTCEYKYDGERAQIHFVSPDSSIPYPATSISATTSPTKGITKIFSRNSEDLSKKYPDILAVLDKWVKPGVESFVLDCEAVAWDKEEKRVLPFQQLMTRKKKDVKIEDVKVKVCVFAFDLLFFNGKSLCQETLEERRRVMHESFAEIEGEFTFATYADANDLEQIQVFLDESVKASCEGLMVKMLDGEESGYEPSKRSRNWLKVKKDYLAGIGDSLDLVVVGAYHGRGKRTGGYGAFLLACYNPSTQNYESICNIGTGFSEANLEEYYTVLSELEIDKPKPYYYHDNGNKQQPDVWFEPKIVWEVKTADLSLSPVYKAAAGMADDTGKGRGISLRFPRFIKVRDDKGPDDATTSSQVADMYKKQEVIINGNKKSSKGVDDDFEY